MRAAAHQRDKSALTFTSIRSSPAAANSLGTIGLGLSTKAASGSYPIFTVGNVPLPVTDVDAGKYTQVGQKPNRVVNLATAGTGLLARFDPVTGASTGFAVPEGFVFVLTDVQASADCSPGGSVVLELLQTTADVNKVTRDFLGSACTIGKSLVERHYDTGLLIGAGSTVSVNLAGTVGSVINLSSQAQGYLVPVGG